MQSPDYEPIQSVQEAETPDFSKQETRIDAPHFLATEPGIPLGAGRNIASQDRPEPHSGSLFSQDSSGDSSFDQQLNYWASGGVPSSLSSADSHGSTGSYIAQHGQSPSMIEIGSSGESSSAWSENSLAPDSMRIQADQLAEYLRSQQDEIDRREAQLNARAAQFDALMRRTKMTMVRRQGEMDQREQQIADAEKSLKDRNKQISIEEREAAERIHQNEQRLVHFEKELDERERALEQRQSRQDQAIDELSRREELLDRRQVELREAEQEYRKVKQTEKLLIEAQAEVARMRHGIIRQREQMQKEIAQSKEQLEGEYGRRIAAVDQQRDELARKSKQLDNSRIALDRARDEIGKMHRETLEIRLATEELWIELSDMAPPEALTRSLGQIRAQLADQYREAIARVSQQKVDLESIRNQLSEQHDHLLKHRKESEAWLADREQAMSQKAQQLAQRESELERRESTFDTLARQWFQSQQQQSPQKQHDVAPMAEHMTKLPGSHQQPTLLRQEMQQSQNVNRSAGDDLAPSSRTLGQATSGTSAPRKPSPVRPISDTSTSGAPTVGKKAPVDLMQQWADLVPDVEENAGTGHAEDGDESAS